eukprot:5998410-Lingulodinium_polyedra.AAC.1
MTAARFATVCASAACRTARNAGSAPGVGAAATKRCANSARMTVGLSRACWLLAASPRRRAARPRRAGAP